MLLQGARNAEAVPRGWRLKRNANGTASYYERVPLLRTHTAAQLLGWVDEQRVLHSVFEGADAHEQLQEQSAPLLAFMAERGHFGAAALASVWAPVAAGRDVDIGQQLVFDKLLKPLVRQGCSSSSGASAAAPWLGAPVLLSMLARLTPAALEGAGGVTDHALDLIALIARHSAQPGVPVAPGGGGGGGGGAADGAGSPAQAAMSALWQLAMGGAAAASGGAKGAAAAAALAENARIRLQNTVSWWAGRSLQMAQQ